jgi:hypothetical protein
MTYYVLVAGSGESTRPNIEALMEDHYYAKGEEGTLVVAYDKQPTKSQSFAAQYSKDIGKDIMVFCNDDASTIGIPGASQSPSLNPVEDAIKFLTGQDAVAYLLWDEDNSILTSCIASQIPAFNLCDGLVPLNEVQETPKQAVKESASNELPLDSVPVMDIRAELQRAIESAQKTIAITQEILKSL